MDYLAFSPEILYAVMNILRSNIGMIFSIAIFVFLVVLGIHIAINILENLIQ